MRRSQPAEHAVDLGGDLGERARTCTFHEFGDRAALRQFHRVPGNVAAAVPIVNRHDGGMCKLCREPRLTPEASDCTFVARDVLVQQLERHFAAE